MNYRIVRRSTIVFALFSAMLMAASFASASDKHEYAPLEEKKIVYKDWTFKTLSDGKPVNLRELTKDRKLVLVVYFAEWCPNWRNEAPFVAKMYEKYKANGFEVVAVSEYATIADARKYFGDKGAPYTVVVESEDTAERDRTTHYAYRQTSGDARKWGSPYNVFLETAKLKKDGDVLTNKTWVVNGELMEFETEAFIRKQLGISEKEIIK